MFLGDRFRTKEHLQGQMLNGNWPGQHHITISDSKAAGTISLLAKAPSLLDMAGSLDSIPSVTMFFPHELAKLFP